MSKRDSARSSLLTRRGRGMKGVAGAFIGLALLFTTACGSDDSDDSTSAAGDGDTSQSDGEPNEETSNENEAPEEDQAPEEGSGSGTEYCGLLESIGDDVLSGGATGSERTEEITALVREIADVAPPDIAADWSTLGDVYEVMSDIDYSDPDALSEIEKFDDLEQVGQRLQQHIQNECV